MEGFRKKAITRGELASWMTGERSPQVGVSRVGSVVAPGRLTPPCAGSRIARQLVYFIVRALVPTGKTWTAEYG